MQPIYSERKRRLTLKLLPPPSFSLQGGGGRGRIDCSRRFFGKERKGKPRPRNTFTKKRQMRSLLGVDYSSHNPLELSERGGKNIRTCPLAFLQQQEQRGELLGLYSTGEEGEEGRVVNLFRARKGKSGIFIIVDEEGGGREESLVL